MENSNITAELSQMEIRLTEMEEKIDSIDKKLNQVVEAILGNSLTKRGGFVDDIEVLKEKIAILEKKQQRDEEFKKRFVWTISIIVAVGVIIQYFLELYSHVK
jgi:chorismate mutase